MKEKILAIKARRSDSNEVIQKTKTAQIRTGTTDQTINNGNAAEYFTATYINQGEKRLKPLAVMRTEIWVKEGTGKRQNRGWILMDRVRAKAESTIVKTTQKIRDNDLSQPVNTN